LELHGVDLAEIRGGFDKFIRRFHISHMIATDLGDEVRGGIGHLSSPSIVLLKATT
jgi:hypothetical protein